MIKHESRIPSNDINRKRNNMDQISVSRLEHQCQRTDEDVLDN
jgi:hypothetical protein